MICIVRGSSPNYFPILSRRRYTTLFLTLSGSFVEWIEDWRDRVSRTAVFT